jgi:hypothetical protein
MRKPILTCATLALLGACSKDPRTLFTDKPDVPVPLAALKWGTPKTEATATAGQAGRLIVDAVYLKGYRGVDVELGFYNPNDTLSRLLVNFPEGTNAGDLAEKLWGAPTMGTEDGKEVRLWLNPDKGVRAGVTKSMPIERMFIEQYSPVETFLGEGKTLAFEAKQPIVGATKAQITAAYMFSSGRVYFPPTRCAKNNVTLLLHFDDQEKVTGYDTRFEDGYCSLDGPVAKQVMEKKFGKPHRLKGGDPTDVYADDPNIIALVPVEAEAAGGMHFAGQGEKGLALAVFIRPTKEKLLEAGR